MLPPTLDSNAFKAPHIDLQDCSKGSLRSIPELIDFNAEENPKAVFCYQAIRSENAANGGVVMTVTMEQLRDAIRTCSKRLRNENPDLLTRFVDGEAKPAPVALFMDSDLSLLLHLFSLLALGVPVRCEAQECDSKH